MLRKILTSLILTLLLTATTSNAVIAYNGIIPGATVPGGIYTPCGSEYPEPKD
jgi:hypothetical protein